jgi:hypothetical protein
MCRARCFRPSPTSTTRRAIQTVDEERHGRFYRLLRAFEQRTGCPALVNTSFNVRGEPIVSLLPEHRHGRAGAGRLHPAQGRTAEPGDGGRQSPAVPGTVPARLTQSGALRVDSDQHGQQPVLEDQPSADAQRPAWVWGGAARGGAARGAGLSLSLASARAGAAAHAVSGSRRSFSSSYRWWGGCSTSRGWAWGSRWAL